MYIYEVVLTPAASFLTLLLYSLNESLWESLYVDIVLAYLCFLPTVKCKNQLSEQHKHFVHSFLINSSMPNQYFGTGIYLGLASIKELSPGPWSLFELQILFKLFFYTGTHGNVIH